jgi:uncharacterized spore protein YtfJ
MRKFGEGNRARKETREPLGGGYGPDAKRPLVCELVVLSDEDVLMMHPKGTRQIVYLRVVDAYRQAVRNKALRALLDKANKAKERKAARAQARRDARFRRRVRRDNQSS